MPQAPFVPHAGPTSSDGQRGAGRSTPYWRGSPPAAAT